MKVFPIIGSYSRMWLCSRSIADSSYRAAIPLRKPMSTANKHLIASEFHCWKVTHIFDRNVALRARCIDWVTCHSNR